MADTDLTATASLGGDRLLGFAIVSLVPAVFWTVVLAAGANANGTALPVSSLLGGGLAIVTATSVLFAALQINPRD